ncbi:double-strand break repair helicase AddA [Alloyangia pacifica]|uniref:DNA 3'-5' helicase n=1 Tax=Alloyangia pacifica TaxID=311180 RepID=A0A1I6U2Y0_9RHOB|nr:double-strand break repair helicase AddA [Alloyangia pacifica]SDH36200.1 DNA helicase/exodeoxyribonuclease V, subunit A [Alloyangia pacifica]SFS95810.1 DNA helicase/exodeoxyribonuclease V, subunit A [Alloyangia pacifica]
MSRNEASEKQVEAARPDASTWLAANAGSGKTRVLTDRVARLLLDEVLPEHILCLTYTKAAATEMQNRLFKRLGAWAMLDDEKLIAELRQLGLDGALPPERLRQARTLFARAIETPGGLRIQTIHSFCASLLRRFPLEAGVSPQFTEMEDRSAEMLRAEVLERMAEGRDAWLVEAMAPFLGEQPEALLAELCGRKAAFLPPRSPEDIRALYGLPGDMDEDAVLAEVFLGSESDLIARVIPVLQTGKSTDQGAAKKLARFTGPDMAGMLALEDALLTQKGTISSRVPTKDSKQALGPDAPRLEQLAQRVESARESRLAVEAVKREITLHRFAQVFLPAYEAEKMRRGWLDFDDLVVRARDLLADDRVADWVLYRLDGGIDHILVDEAQDTSPVQWQVIERLAREFTSGEGARGDVRRTIFVVGDKKQSIYSFQGADPREFDRMCDDFAERLQGTDAPLSRMMLEYSFRSAGPVLKLVDATFEGREESGFSPEQRHKAFKSEMPGRVDLWPHIEPAKEEEEDAEWYEPVDRIGAQHHTVRLANRIALFIAETIGKPLPVEIGFSGEYKARPAHAGDFLILVRRRGTLFTEIIRAIKARGLPIAGADRLKVMSELAVKDIGALLAFLATPEDDLSLATALRSPLFGLTEKALFDLAHHRKPGSYLWVALRERREEFPAVLQVMDDLLNRTDFLRPYDLIERILTRHRGRQKLLGRLGEEAEDGINALLQQALAYEQSTVPSLTGFLEWMQSDDLEIKRAPDSAGARIRVMTVHGSKGLEAPIVILPDCAQPTKTIRERLLPAGEGETAGMVWQSSAAAQPQVQSDALERAKAAAERERDRLLYVALTRAEKWLVVAAAGNLGKDGSAWFDQVSRGMERAGAEKVGYDFGRWGSGEGLRLGQADWSHLAFEQVEAQVPVLPDLPPHLLTPAPVPAPLPESRSPSDLGGAKALAGIEGLDEEEAKLRGTVLHLLLEHLAPLAAPERAGAVPHVLTLAEDLPEETDSIVTEALAVLGAPALAPVFAGEALAEVPISAEIEPVGRIHGVIDRLLVTPEKIVALDFKSNRTVPATPAEVPEGLLRQMGAYAAALTQVFPGRSIETGLVWTATQELMVLPHDLVSAALSRTTIA